MSRWRKILLLAIIVLSLGGLTGTVIAKNRLANASDDTCVKSGVAHQVTIKDNRVSPEFTDGHLCDTLTITNQDTTTRAIAFGPHDDHVPYDGIAEKFLNRNQSFTLTFNKLGMFHFHDHLHDEVMGYFNVAK